MSKKTIQDMWPEEGQLCWGCGKRNEHGLQLKSYWDKDEVVATWEPEEHHQAFPGVLNGGIIATLIDCHGTGTANAAGLKEITPGIAGNYMYVTSSLKVNYLRPTPLDSPITLRARVIGQTEKKISVECSLYSGGLECANGEITTVRVDTRKFLRR